MLKKLMYCTAVVAVLGVMGFGAQSLSAAQRVLPSENCPGENNYCWGTDPDFHCNYCCGQAGGVCVMYGGGPSGPQDCLCRG